MTATRNHTVGILAATAGLATTLLTALACVGPLVAILLGVGGFGWLTRYAHLRVPASVATALILLAGFRHVYGAARQGRSCDAPRSQGRAARLLLWTAALLAIAVNIFEYAIFPRLG